MSTISVTDPVSGVTSTGDDNAAFNVPGALLSIALTPEAVALDVGETKSLVATGTFEGGVTKNITQSAQLQLVGVGVATATNSDGNKSLINAVAQGRRRFRRSTA
jgi:hypothetical protein